MSIEPRSLTDDIDHIKSIVSVGAVTTAICLLEDLSEKVAALEAKAEFVGVKKQSKGEAQ